jgi:hypothetical protein
MGRIRNRSLIQCVPFACICPHSRYKTSVTISLIVKNGVIEEAAGGVQGNCSPLNSTSIMGQPSGEQENPRTLEVPGVFLGGKKRPPEVTEAASANVKRKRGRPRKAEIQDPVKKRGRPFKKKRPIPKKRDDEHAPAATKHRTLEASPHVTGIPCNRL